MMKHLLPFAISLISLPVFLTLLLLNDPQNWEQLALGVETYSPRVVLPDGTPAYASVSQNVIHCETLKNCVFNYGGKEPTVLWLGNSQLHAINQYQKGQKLASELLYEKLIQKSEMLLTISHPSANTQEHYVILEHIKELVPINSLILGLVFDDFREHGVRPDIAKVLGKESLKITLGETGIGSKILQRTSLENEKNEDILALKLTNQEKTEQWLNSTLKKHSEAWERRAFLRGLIVNSLYKTRNFLFRINPSTKRKIILPRYLDNLSALKAILESTRKSDINTLIYIAPIRNDVEIPYSAQEYEVFKGEVEVLAEKYNANFTNLENLIEPSFWGMKDSTTVANTPELDFMHFRFEGHQTLASKIFQLTQIKN